MSLNIKVEIASPNEIDALRVFTKQLVEDLGRIDPFGLSEGYIKQFFLKPKFRGRGVGRILLEKALEHLKKIKVEKVKVNIKEKAMEASNLYEKMNFKKVYEVLELDLTKNSSND
jgi:ribosomal protein S18 acetylase RimI-like enzyme